MSTLRLCLFTASFFLAGLLQGQPANKSAAVIAVMERVADWQLANPSKWPALDWEPAAGYTGIMALASVSDSPRFEAAMLKLGEDNQWKLGPRPYHADDYCVAQTYIELYLRHHDARMIAPTRAGFDAILAKPSAAPLDFDRKKNPHAQDRWAWCDALFMGPPGWARLATATGNQAYLDFAVREWWTTSDYLYDKAEHLYYRDSTYFTKREANGQKVFWARGNGWVMGGLVRLLQYLPADHPSRPRFEQQFHDMAERVAALQQSDGLWRSSLLDPASYPLKETSGSGFYCYALAWGVNHGLLDRATYTPVVVKAWSALTDCVAPDGKLTHVQPVGADPKKFPEDATEIYGVGAFLLAGSEVCRMP